MNYISKAKDSFRTKLNLFLYERVVNDITEFNLEDFKNYSVRKEIIDQYTTVYWQEQTTFIIGKKTIHDIEQTIANLRKEKVEIIKELENYYIKEVFPTLFPIDQFDALTGDKCAYCGISTAEINALANDRKLRKKNLRGWNLEIDRLDSNEEYKPDNCVMCCYWCNNAKTDEFTPEEFRKIGTAIGEIWAERSGKIKD